MAEEEAERELRARAGAEGPAGRLDLLAAAGPTVVARAGPELPGVLVDPRRDPGAAGWSPEDASPQAAFAPYGGAPTRGTRRGPGLLQRALDLPVLLLAAEEEDAEALAGWSTANCLKLIKQKLEN